MSSELKLSLTVHPAHLASGPPDHAARSSDQHRCLTRPLQGPPCRGSGAPRLLQGWGSTALPLWLDDCICSFLFPRQTNHYESAGAANRMLSLSYSSRPDIPKHLCWSTEHYLQGSYLLEAPGWNLFPCLLSNIWRLPSMPWPMSFLSSPHLLLPVPYLPLSLCERTLATTLACVRNTDGIAAFSVDSSLPHATHFFPDFFPPTII